MQYESTTFLEKLQPISLNAENNYIKLNSETAYNSYNSLSIIRDYEHSASIKKRFLELRNAWKREIGMLSDSDLRNSNSNYLEIIRLGYPVLPYILEDLNSTKSHWFYALSKITGANPIQPEHRGNIQAMKDDWNSWVKANVLT